MITPEQAPMRYNVTPRRCPVFLVYSVVYKPRGLTIFRIALLARHLGIR